ncbi:2-nitropropane dioxygenase [Hahella sp. CCB-MM4]|uniref:NAD(P)H-dependent flavin oxidoreductase n=1 Tax=Hahella sp. (strain CCB-MM4) TaxID=1926491 RepID=UPI000B9A25F7|nr:nitronate monooxygenase [Hahella sp. CCB-MM4]OZG75221.1 2-nitropropane dioxygenase [Hahella sp. CCB-MM4]
MSIRHLLGIELPIIQAPMAGVQDHRLAVAVSNAGGLGSLPCAMLTSENLRKELEAIRQATDRPYNVNFFCHQIPKPNPQREQQWKNVLSPYYREFNIDTDSIPSGPGRLPFSQESLDVLKAFRPPVVSFHFGLPEPGLLDQVKGWGAKILASATTIEEALWLEQREVDVIIAQGLEAGGHRGMFLTDDITTQMGSYALLPQILDAVRVPVVAAGGIANNQGVSAALGMGAAGAQVGTAYLLCPEATTTAIHRRALKSEGARHTALTNVFSGKPARGIVNRFMRETGPMSSSVAPFPLAAPAVAPLRSAAEGNGSGDFSPLWAGQNVSGCQEISATELTRQLAGMID